MANLFAQINNGNWNTSNQWNTVANGSGSFVTPTSNDVCISNNKIVFINVSTVVLQLRNDTLGGATSGGYFELLNGVSLTSEIVSGPSTNPCVRFNQSSGNLCTITGNITGGSGTSSYGFQNVSSGTVNINGNITGGTGTNCWGVLNTTGTLNITGIANGGPSGTTNHALYNNGSGSIVLNGNPFGSNNGSGVVNSSTGNFTIVGMVTGGSGTSIYGANNSGTGIMLIFGDIYGGSGASCFGANCANTGTLRHQGTVYASNSSPGISGVVGGKVFLTGPFICSSNGVNANVCQNWRWNNQAIPTTPTYIKVFNEDLITFRNLNTADSVGGVPNQADVKQGVIYGIDSSLVGTLVDNSNIVALLSTITPSTPNEIATAVRNELAVELTRIRNCATIDSVGNQLANILSS